MKIGIHRLVLGLCIWLLSTVQVVCAAEKTQEEHAKAILEWVTSKEGGSFNDKLEMRRFDMSDPKSPVGMFAKGDIAEDDVILSVPRDVLITAEDDTKNYGGIWCPTVYNLVREMKLGDDSKYAPYVNYLLSQRPGQLPSAWSVEGQELLLWLLGQTDSDRSNDLPPTYATGWLEWEWQDCSGSDDPFDENAALLVVQRAWDDLLLPLYDMMSHRNGKWLNTKSDSVYENMDQPIVARASRDIAAGEQIYMSYNYCADCGARAKNYGTPEILRDYGFVEQYPQRWYFGKANRLSFALDENESGKVVVEWLEKKRPTKKGIRFLFDVLERLDDFASLGLAKPNPSIPKEEIDTIKNYHQAMMNAIQLALDDLDVSYKGSNCVKGDDSCALSARYDNLAYVPDELDYATYTCDTGKSMSFKGFDKMEDLESHYQAISYSKDPKNDNVCFSISNVIQMCGSYRPHYHEMVVHYTGRFIPEVKRVIFVGGGDSMLLHDIVKYPSLELVVGLELDQVITRLSYKHLGTQPLFENEKVQWWFGDAAKSLLMLPEDYFGSFDMVLVDLSETVMSFLVTDGLDILQALSLLLKPNGIMVKNELYLEKMSDIFDYSIQIHYDYVPVICSQCLILGSNNVDFFFDELTDHDIKNMYIKPQAEIDDRYEYFHDYRRNATSEHLCKEEGDPEVEPTEQTRSPGILMILEAEDTTVQLKDAKKLSDVLKKAVKKAGLEVISTESSSTRTGVIVSLVLQEGYVTVRTWPEHNYAAMDVHLWSSFSKHEDAKKALIEAVGSKAPSAYRIVAGGMFGVSTWKEDDKKRGPRIVDICNRGGDETVRDKKMDVDVAKTIFRESMKLIPETEGISIAVVCAEKEEDCITLDILAKYPGATVVPLMACASLGNEYEKSALENMKACEKETLATLMDAVSGDNKIRVLVIDPSASHVFTQVVYKVFKTGRNQIINRKSVAAMAILFDEEESWRRNLMERFRTDIIYLDPNFRAETRFNSTDSFVELAVAASGDEGFNMRLRNVIARIEKETGLISDLKDVTGGQSEENPKWEASHFFLPEDFDQSGPLEQWESQQPVALQIVSQLEPRNSKKPLDVSAEKLFSALEETLNEVETVTWRQAKAMKQAQFHEVSEVGEGCIFVALWADGSCVVLWDGRNHIDLNLFVNFENFKFADEFTKVFKSKFPKKFKTALLDVQPRGFGRVVSFKKDIEVPGKPHWAKFKE